MTEDELLKEVLDKLDEIAPFEKPEPGEFCAQDYADRHGITEKSATHRLQTLVESGILTCRKIRHKLYYKITTR